MGFNFAAFLAALLGKKKPSTPLTYRFSFLAQDRAGRPLVDTRASFQFDDASAPLVVNADADGRITLQTTARGRGVTVTLSKAGYQPKAERRLLPLLSTEGPAPEWPAVTVLDARVVDPGPSPIPIPIPPVVPSADAIVLADAVIAARDCPDVRAWPIFAPLRSVTIADRESFERGDTMPDFEGRDTLPPADGTQGAISYTLWLGCWMQSAWHVLPIVECIRGYVPTGQLLQPGQLSANLTYFADAPLRGYQPQTGENVIMFCTTGDTRRQNAQADGMTAARTTVLKVPWRVGVTTA
jgi:hypothetical protein